MELHHPTATNKAGKAAERGENHVFGSSCRDHSPPRSSACVSLRLAVGGAVVARRALRGLRPVPHPVCDARPDTQPDIPGGAERLVWPGGPGGGPVMQLPRPVFLV